MSKPTTNTHKASRTWWIYGALGFVIVLAGVFVVPMVINSSDKHNEQTVGSMLDDQPHPFEDQAAAGSSVAAAPKSEISPQIYGQRLAELASILGISADYMNPDNWPEIVLQVDHENRAAMRVMLENILHDAIERGDISYVDRDRVLYAFDLGLIDAPLSAISKFPIDGEPLESPSSDSPQSQASATEGAAS